jgi:hypothetical protein
MKRKEREAAAAARMMLEEELKRLQDKCQRIEADKQEILKNDRQRDMMAANMDGISSITTELLLRMNNDDHHYDEVAHAESGRASPGGTLTTVSYRV